MVLTIKVELLVGCTIREAIKDACYLSANMGNITVQFEFNGVTVMVDSNTNIDKGCEKVIEEMNTNKKYKVVFA
jgi:hypothetical protein